MKLFPSIDLHDGKVVRLHKGEFDQETIYSANAVDQAQMFADEGATWLHVVDLDGARTGQRMHDEVIERICRATSLQIQVGGGIRSEESIQKLLSLGVKRCILGTAALQNWAWFEALVNDPAHHDRIVLGLDARSGKLAVSGWEQQTQDDALEIARRVSDWPLGAIVYTDIASDGTMEGPNIAATGQIAEATRTPVIASGGIGSLDDLRALRDLSISGVIVGKALYERVFSVKEAIAVLDQGR